MPSILIIDDNRELRDFMRLILEEAGHQIREANDGAEGIRSYDQQPADLVICDVFMPGKEGLETIQELRSRFPGVRVISMSGGSASTPGNYLAMAKAFGAAGTLNKPFGVAELLEAIRKVLE